MLQHTTNDDRLIDLCPNPQIQQLNSSRNDYSFPGGDTPFTLQMPDQRNSWLSYTCNFITQEKPNVAIHKKLKRANPNDMKANGIGQPNGNPGFNIQDIQQQSSPSNPYETIIQQRSGADFYLKVKGQAVRGGYRAPPPVCVSVGGIPAVRIGGTWACQTLVPSEICPIYGTEWELDYILQGKPQGDLVATIVTDGHPENVV